MPDVQILLGSNASMWVFPKSRKHKDPIPRPQHVFCTSSLIQLCSQSQQVLNEVASTQQLLHRRGVTPIQWHIPSNIAGCQEFKALCENAARAITLYGAKCVVSLQIAGTARFLFSLSTGHYAQSSGSAGCELVVTVCLRFHWESWQQLCVWACQYKRRPQLTRICVSLHKKLFTASIKRGISHIHKLKHYQMKKDISSLTLCGNHSYPHTLILSQPVLA